MVGLASACFDPEGEDAPTVSTSGDSVGTTVDELTTTTGSSSTGSTDAGSAASDAGSAASDAGSAASGIDPLDDSGQDSSGGESSFCRNDQDVAGCTPCLAEEDCLSGRCDEGACEWQRPVSCVDEAPEHASSLPAEVMIAFLPEEGWETAPACDWQCEPGYGALDDACATEQQVPCRDVAPLNAASTMEDVLIEYVEGEGWPQIPECEWSCDRDYDRRPDGCIDELEVECEDHSPDNAQTIVRDVTITYSSDEGWPAAPACEWACVNGLCRSGDACVEPSDEPLAIEFATGVASSYFGGGTGPRSVGVGQSFSPEATLQMERYAIHLENAFQLPDQAPAGDVVLVLQLRDATGGILDEETVDLSSDFAGGWVYWDMPALLTEGETYIFTTFVRDGIVSLASSGVSGDEDARWPGGQGTTAEITSSGQSFEPWTVWQAHAWDFWFRIEGTEHCYAL